VSLTPAPVNRKLKWLNPIPALIQCRRAVVSLICMLSCSDNDEVLRPEMSRSKTMAVSLLIALSRTARKCFISRYDFGDPGRGRSRDFPRAEELMPRSFEASRRAFVSRRFGLEVAVGPRGWGGGGRPRLSLSLLGVCV
jgi:hypothetical protein